MSSLKNREDIYLTAPIDQRDYIDFSEKLTMELPDIQARILCGYDFSWIDPIIERLGYIINLSPDWNGPGSVAIDIETALKALEVMFEILQPSKIMPSISPGADGSLQIGWFARDYEIEIYIKPHTMPTASLYDRNTSEEWDEMPLTSTKLHDAIASLPDN